MVQTYKVFDGKRYKRSIGGVHGRKFTKTAAHRHAALARTAGMAARSINMGNLGWVVYTRASATAMRAAKNAPARP